MAEKFEVFKVLGHVFPEKSQKTVDQMLVYAGREPEGARWLGKHLLLTMNVSAILFAIIYFWNGLPVLYTQLTGPVIFVSIFFGRIARLSLAGDKRAVAVEQILPSALQLMAANIRAGMTPDRAIWLSARPEFGPFQAEIKRIGSETLGGTPIAEAFISISKRIKSAVVERTVSLVVEGMESGGELAKLLTATAEELQSIAMLKKEMNANVATYVMFVGFASLAGAPLLLGISTFFVDMLTRMGNAIGFDKVAEEAGSTGVVLVGISSSVTPTFLLQFSIAVISVTTFFAALLVGLIRHGDEKRGLEFAPIFVIAGLAIFFIVRMMVQNMFGSMLAI